MTTILSRAVARSWIDRWDVQQQSFLPDREERFAALIDAVQECSGRPDPLVLDLGCGPGSLAMRVLERLPSATVIGVDADPLLLALGRAPHRVADRVRSAMTQRLVQQARSPSSTSTCVNPAGPVRSAWTGPRTPRSARLRCTGCHRTRWQRCMPRLRTCSGRAAWC
jgi:hypothetical protein